MKVICVECGQEKEERALGLCGACYGRLDYQKNRQRELARKRCHYQECGKQVRAQRLRHYKENRERLLAYKHRYYEENQERLLAYRRRYREENREQVLACERRYLEKNPGKRAECQARRVASEQKVADTLTSEQLEFEREVGEATYPGQELHMHHLVPLSKGGGHTWGNIAFIPASLNLSIGAKLPEEVYKQMTLEA